MGHSYTTLPAEGGRLANVFTALKLERAKRKGRINKFPAMTALDEYPAVPYLIDGAGTFHYDSTGISRWLDLQPADSSSRRLWPRDPGLAFVAQLIDDAMDEFGLYLVHHQRWVHSRKTNDAGKRIFQEMATAVVRQRKINIWKL